MALSVHRKITLQTWPLVVFALSTLFWNRCDGVGLHKESNDYCYTDPDCGPGSDYWGEQCQDGLRQSPISVPVRSPILPGVTALQLSSYQSETFRMQNTGHTVVIEFLEGEESSHTNFLGGDAGSSISNLFPFPDPFVQARFGREETHYYRFASAHFHWGENDHIGSEHCFDDRCFSMELHLVHILSAYDSMEDALSSGDPNAMAVIAVMLDVTPAAGEGNPVIAPIVRNLFQIEEASHDDWAYVNAPLDFTPMLDTGKPTFVYSYKGSLTTPDCNEQVNWYVFKRPIAISHRDVKAFRYLRDSKGGLLRENHRPLQRRNGRPVYMSAVKSI